MGTITINLPARPKGELIELLGIGVFENGEAHEVEGVDDMLVGLPLDGDEDASQGGADSSDVGEDVPPDDEDDLTEDEDQPTEEDTDA